MEAFPAGTAEQGMWMLGQAMGPAASVGSRLGVLGSGPSSCLIHPEAESIHHRKPKIMRAQKGSQAIRTGPLALAFTCPRENLRGLFYRLGSS